MLRSMCGTTDTPSVHALPELCLSAFAEPIDLLDFDLLLESFSSESQFALCIRQLKCSFSSSWAPVSWSFSLYSSQFFLLEPSLLSLYPTFLHTARMVQGNPKGLQKQKSSGSRHAAKAAAATKKGKRYVAPKKAAAVKSASLHKVSKLKPR